jgi:hypothetical protein
VTTKKSGHPTLILHDATTKARKLRSQKNNPLKLTQMNIKVCVGSSCHLKGSYEVIQALKDILKKYDVEDLVELQASFCLGHCAKGVNVKTDDISENMMKKASISAEDGFLLLHNVTKDNAEELFAKEIYPLIEF